MNPIIISVLTQVLLAVLKEHGVSMLAYGLPGLFLAPGPSSLAEKYLSITSDDERIRIVLKVAGVEVDIERSFDDLNYDFQWAVDWIEAQMRAG